jgi:hypothetical protein
MRGQIGRYRLRLQSKSASVALLSLLICALSLAPVTFALDSADEWDQQVDSNGIITLTDGTILIQGSNNAGPGYPWENTVTGLTTSSSIGETVSFDWEYWTTDGADYDRAQMLLNESWVDLAIWNQGGYNPQQQSGSQEVYVTSGGIFGFRIMSIDSCCGAGFLQINNTTWVVGSPAPSPTPTPEPTPTPTPEPTPTPTPEPTPTPTPEPTPTLTPTPTAVVPSPSATPDPRRIGIAEPEPVHAARAVATAVAMTVGGAIGLLWGGAAVAQVVRRRFKRTVAFDDKLRDTGAPHK